MKRETKRIEALLKGTRENLALVRAEMKDGASLQHAYDDLKSHEQLFDLRLRELKDFNAAEEKREAEAKAKADAEAKAKADAAGAGSGETTEPTTGKETYLKEFADKSKKELIGIKKSTEEALAKDPDHIAAKAANEAVIELLQKFN